MSDAGSASISTAPRPLYKVTRFRKPSPAEQAMRLWVDRANEYRGPIVDSWWLRVLGQYAVAAVLRGHGTVYTETGGMQSAQSGDVLLQVPEEGALWTTQCDDFHYLWIDWSGPENDDLRDAGVLWRTNELINGMAHHVECAYREVQPALSMVDATTAVCRKAAILTLISRLQSARLGRAYTGTALVVGKAIQMMASACNETIQIVDVAKELGVSPGHLGRLFRQVTGQGPKQYLTSLRICRAQEYLAIGMSVKEVAFKVGYSDQLYFSRIFRQVTGMTPTNYTKRFR